MKRSGRLASARSWLPKYSGKNVLRGYCKHFGVDWRCAAVELARLGVKIDPQYLARRETTEAEELRRREAQTRQLEALETTHWHPYTDPFSAYLAGDFAALHELEQQANNEDAPAEHRTDDTPF
jgi:hypothetical protein